MIFEVNVLNVHIRIIFYTLVQIAKRRIWKIKHKKQEKARKYNGYKIKEKNTELKKKKMEIKKKNWNFEKINYWNEKIKNIKIEKLKKRKLKNEKNWEI